MINFSWGQNSGPKKVSKPKQTALISFIKKKTTENLRQKYSIDNPKTKITIIPFPKKDMFFGYLQ